MKNIILSVLCLFALSTSCTKKEVPQRYITYQYSRTTDITERDNTNFGPWILLQRIDLGAVDGNAKCGRVDEPRPQDFYDEIINGRKIRTQYKQEYKCE